MNNYINLSHNINGEIMYIFNSFIIYSILGYLFEIIVSLLLGNSLNSGFMYGPYTPIYGISIMLLFSLFDKFRFIKPNLKKYIIMLFSSFIIITFLELFGGELIKILYHKELWNYSKLPLSLNNYISLEVSLFWSIGIILIYKYLKPITDKWSKKIPKYLTLIILLIMFIDFIITNINLIKI